jgi:hypothetical protein
MRGEYPGNNPPAACGYLIIKGTISKGFPAYVFASEN